MNKEILYEILKSESESLSTAEIEGILNEELDKSPDEMDTDLVDLCLEALTTVDEEKLNKRKRKIRIERLLIAAIIFALLIGLSVPVCAKFFSIDVPDGVVSFYNDCFNIDISQDGRVDDILARLERDGISDAVLPKAVFSAETEISYYELKFDSEVDFSFSCSDINGYVTIEKHDAYDFVENQYKATDAFDNVKQLDVNGLSVLVFCNNDVSYISYAVNNVEYNIAVYCDYETACQIAETI